MKPVFIISILIVGVLGFLGGRMPIAPKLKIAQNMVTQLEAEKSQLTEELEQLRANRLSDTERKRIERERKELAGLRGEAAKLRTRVEDLERPKPEPREARAAAEEEEEEPAFEEADYYAATVNVEVEDGMTLITGGWLTAPGRRTFVFMTPTRGTSPDGEGFIQINTKIADLADESLAAFHLQNMRANSNETDNAGGFDAEDARMLFQGIQKAEGAVVLASPSIVTVDGREALVKTSVTFPRNGQSAPGQFEIGVVPVVTKNGDIQMTVASTITIDIPESE
ncbi:MAG: hypothetical protein HOH33_00280 [Verrucomicrobia bacterium]|jgi:hypothetical protein|nr:hypothetical protein [Verrucomicrobiota bacterium]